MILQALCDYYENEAKNPESDIAPLGREWKKINYLIIIDNDGKFIELQNTTSIVGKKKITKSFLVPKSVGRGSNIVANLLWDTMDYVLGLTISDDPKKAVTAIIKNQAFVNEVVELSKRSPHDAAIDAIVKFYGGGQIAEIQNDETYKEIIRTTKENEPRIFTFQLFGETIRNMYEHDRAAARGLMAVRGLYVFEHDSELGNAPAHELFDRVAIEKISEGPAREFTDYKVTLDEAGLTSVKLHRLVGK